MFLWSIYRVTDHNQLNQIAATFKQDIERLKTPKKVVLKAADTRLTLDNIDSQEVIAPWFSPGLFRLPTAISR